MIPQSPRFKMFRKPERCFWLRKLIPPGVWKLKCQGFDKLLDSTFFVLTYQCGECAVVYIPFKITICLSLNRRMSWSFVEVKNHENIHVVSFRNRNILQMQFLLFDLVPEEAIEVKSSQRSNHGVPQIWVGVLEIFLYFSFLDLLTSERDATCGLSSLIWPSAPQLSSPSGVDHASTLQITSSGFSKMFPKFFISPNLVPPQAEAIRPNGSRSPLQTI